MEKNLLKHFSKKTDQNQLSFFEKNVTSSSLNSLLEEMNHHTKTLKSDLLSPKIETVLKIMASVRVMN